MKVILEVVLKMRMTFSKICLVLIIFLLSNSPVLASDLPDEVNKSPKKEEKSSFEEDILKSLNLDNVVINKNAVAELRGLNKITARTSEVRVKSGAVSSFGNLEITLHDCRKSLPSEKPEAKALLEIWENKLPTGKEKIFLGWMFMSSPSLSTLEHPVYDITVQGCG